MLHGFRNMAMLGGLAPAAPDVAVVSVATFAASATASSHNVTLPSSSAGNLLIMVLRAGTTTTATRPTGWDEVVTPRNSTGVTYIWKRTATGSEGATVSVSLSTSIRCTAVTYSISGVTQGVEGTFAATNVNNPPSQSASWGTDRNLFIAVMTNRRSDSSVTAAPTNYGSLTTIAPASDTATSRTRVSTATRILTAASDDPGAFTTSGTIDTPHSATLVVR
jgi:hypothetical protein